MLAKAEVTCIWLQKTCKEKERKPLSSSHSAISHPPYVKHIHPSDGEENKVEENDVWKPAGGDLLVTSLSTCEKPLSYGFLLSGGADAVMADLCSKHDKQLKTQK